MTVAPPLTTSLSSIYRSDTSSSSMAIAHCRRNSSIHLHSTGSANRIGEIAGSTAAECAAICCCFPCGIVSLVVLAVVKLPAGLCRKAYVRRRRRRVSAMRKGSSFDEEELDGWRTGEEWGIPSVALSAEVAAMEQEMWTKFYGTGFWRSPSQREMEF